MKFDFQNTNFDGIIGGLNAGRYDLALTSMIDKKARQETVDFVDYLNSGVTFMVAKGNPKGLKDKLDLCGKTAAVEKSSTGDLSVDDITKECTAAGKPAVTKQPFPDQASAVQALQSGRADAVVALDLTLAYNVKTAPHVLRGRRQAVRHPARRHPGAQEEPAAARRGPGRPEEGHRLRHVRPAAGQVEPAETRR